MTHSKRTLPETRVTGQFKEIVQEGWNAKCIVDKRYRVNYLLVSYVYQQHEKRKRFEFPPDTSYQEMLKQIPTTLEFTV